MTTDLNAVLESIIGPTTRPIPRDTSPAAFEDEDTLRRSRHALTSSSLPYRRRMDQPREPWLDELAVALGDRRSSEVDAA